jgi:hypothetical protein
MNDKFNWRDALGVKDIPKFNNKESTEKSSKPQHEGTVLNKIVE